MKNEKKLPQHVAVDNDSFRKNLSQNELLVYVMLKSYMNGTSLIAFPKQSTLQKDTGLSIPTIKKCLENLEQKNEIKIIREGKLHKYKFNEHSDNYEMYSHEFLKDIDIKKDLKAFLIAMQPIMFKDDIPGVGKVTMPTTEIATVTGLSEDTILRKNKELMKLGICEEIPCNTMSGNRGRMLMYGLMKIGQEFVTMRNQVKENTQDIANIKDDVESLKKAVRHRDKIIIELLKKQGVEIPKDLIAD